MAGMQTERLHDALTFHRVLLRIAYGLAAVAIVLSLLAFLTSCRNPGSGADASVLIGAPLPSQSITGTGCASTRADNQGVAGWEIEGTWTGTIDFQASVDGTTFHAVQATSPGGTVASSTTAVGAWILNSAGYQIVEACGASVSGTATVVFNVSPATPGGSGSGSGSGSTVSVSNFPATQNVAVTAPTATAGQVPTTGWAPVEVSQAPQSNCPDQAFAIGDAGNSTVLVDASIVTTGVARRIWIGQGGTFCGTKLNDTTTCPCYLNVAAGTYLDGLWTQVCSVDAGTTAGSFVLER